MISLTLARQLKEAGLVWQTAVNDFFAIPDRGMDDKIFVISDMMVTMDLLRGWPALTFHGTAEWAADHLLTHEAIWLPTEEQLRDALAGLLRDEAALCLRLALEGEHYVCDIIHQGENLTFQGTSAGEAYGLALRHILSGQNSP